MTAKKRDVEEVLSRALHSETDQVEPVGDGLTKIRARLGEPWLKRRWWLLRNEFMMLGWFVAVRGASLSSTVRGRSGPDDTVGSGAGDPEAGTAGAGHGLRRRVAPIYDSVMAWVTGKGDPRRPTGPVMNWLRPALAVAGAVVLVVAGVFALGQIRQSIQAGLSAGGSGYNTQGTSGQNTGPGSTNGRVGSHSLPGSGSPTSRGSTSPSPGASHNTGVAPSSSPCPSPTSSSGATLPPSPTPPPPSPTVSASPTPTGTATPTATPTSTPSQAPLSSLHADKDRRGDDTRTTALVCPGGPAPSTSASPA